MTGPLYHVGRWCTRHNRVVITLWIIAVVGLALAGRAVGDRTSDNLTLPGTDSTRATNVLEARLPDQANGSNPLVLQSSGGKLTSSKNEKAVNETVKQVRDTPHVIKAVNPLSDKGSEFLSKDKKIGYIPVTLDVGQSDITDDEAQALLDAGEPARKAGIDVSLGGYAGQQLSKPDTHMSEAIGLGVGIDYALFIVTRHKLQLRDGMEMEESIARATATAGGAVLFAGTTVVIALASLLFAGIPLVTKLGYCAAVAVVVSVIGATTLLPALLGALGPRINSLRVKLGRTHPDDHRPHGWARWARGVARRPWISVVAATAVLVVLALPVTGLHLGQSDTGALPESTTARQAYDGIAKGFGAGTNGPLLVAAELGKPAKPDQKNLNEIDKKQKQLQQQQQLSFRSLVVPAKAALMNLLSVAAAYGVVTFVLGKASWWMPSWLGRRLPRISVEGEEYFAKHPAPAAEAKA